MGNPSNQSAVAQDDLQPENLVAPSDPSAVAVIGPERSLTWEQLERRSRQLAQALDGAGVGVGGVWGVLARNRCEWAEFQLGNARAGSRVVPLNWHLTPVELTALIDDSGCRLIVVDPDLRAVAEEAAAGTTVTRIIELGDEYESWLVDAGDGLLTARAAGTALMFTGGTTGKSKGVTRPELGAPASARIEYSIVDDDGNDLPAGEVGTIYCRRSDGAPEYYGDPDKTASIKLSDGRFTVGDLGWLDDDGFLYLADRRVDLILIAGSNVYPAEIEAVLSEHPSVADVAVFGIPDPEWGQQVKAVIEPSGDIDLDDVRAFAATRLAAYKLPKSYDVVDRLPREAHGKLKKRLLRDPYWADSAE